VRCLDGATRRKIAQPVPISRLSWPEVEIFAGKVAMGEQNSVATPQIFLDKRFSLVIIYRGTRGTQQEKKHLGKKKELSCAAPENRMNNHSRLSNEEVV